MRPLRAHVYKGQIVLDEPVELRDGTSIEVHVLEDELERMSRAEFEAEIEASAAEIERGEYEDARVVAARLFAKA